MSVHLVTFVAAFFATLEYGLERAQAVCKNRVRALREELEQVQKTVEVYLRRHYTTTVLNYKDKVREVLLTAMNGGLKAGMIDLASRGASCTGSTNTRPPGPAQVSPCLR